MRFARVMAMAILPTALVLLGGCSLFQQQEAQPQVTSAVSSQPAGQGTTVSSTPAKSPGRYYDFNDILIPPDMDLSKSDSILFRVGTFKAGLLVFKGNYTSASLVNFFIDNMAKDNWVLKSSFKYPKVALFFAKKGKTCVIYIDEGPFSTDVEIWVAPAL